MQTFVQLIETSRLKKKFGPIWRSLKIGLICPKPDRKTRILKLDPKKTLRRRIAHTMQKTASKSVRCSSRTPRHKIGHKHTHKHTNTQTDNANFHCTCTLCSLATLRGASRRSATLRCANNIEKCTSCIQRRNMNRRKNNFNVYYIEKEETRSFRNMEY
jgi:hypothetical protein